VLIDRLLSRLARCRLAPFVKLGKTIRKHRDGILAAIRLGINQGRTEALNNKVRLITRRVRLSLRQGRAGAHHAHLRTHHPSPATRTTHPRNCMTLTTSIRRELVSGLPKAERLIGERETIPEAAKELGISEQTYYRWRNGTAG
jgi:hypothetical protein